MADTAPGWDPGPGALVARLLAEEHELQFGRFDAALVWALGTRLRDAAVAGGHPVAIDVSRGADTVFFFANDGATVDNTDWIRRKRATVLRFHHSSHYMHAHASAGGYDFYRRYRLPDADYLAGGGSVPILVRGVGLVGAATVSGLASAEDHDMVVAQMRSLLTDFG